MAESKSKKSRWYEFRLSARGPSHFVSVPIGDDLMTAIRQEANSILTRGGEDGVGVFELDYLAEASDCLACREDQPNQEAHAQYGGCLHISSQSSQGSDRHSDNLTRKRSRTASNGSFHGSSSLSL